MADLTFYNDLDKGTYLAAKQLLLLATIARAVPGADGEIIVSCEDDARTMLAKLADQAQRRSADPRMRDAFRPNR